MVNFGKFERTERIAERGINDGPSEAFRLKNDVYRKVQSVGNGDGFGRE